jgi:phosphatidylserine decarboxylase
MSRDGGYLAGEGGWFVLASVLVAGGAVLLSLPWLALAALGVAVAALVLFRDPPRQVPSAPLAVVCPLDGVVESIDEVASNGAAARIVIVLRISRLGAWSIRAPVEGKVMGLRGLEDGPERGLWLRTDEGDDVVTELRGPTRPYWFRPVSVVKTGERLGQGQRFGYRRMARTAFVHVYGDAKIGVSQGQRVRAGSDLLATLVHE